MKSTRIFGTVLLACVLGLAACERAPELAGPDDLAPQFSNGQGRGGAPGQVKRNPALRLVENGSLSGQSATAQINASGGILAVPGAYLIVPNGAVTGRPVTFTMTGLDDVYGVDLRAVRGSENVGRAGFRRGVTICLQWDGVVAQSSQKFVAQYFGAGNWKLVSSSTNGAWVCGTTNHFSQYVMVAD